MAAVGTVGGGPRRAERRAAARPRRTRAWRCCPPPPAVTARGGGRSDEGLAAWRRTRRADALGVFARTDLAARAGTLRSAPARGRTGHGVVRGALTTTTGRRLLAEAVAGPRPA
ncbi:hypothetical protein BCL76_10489 [Streptomyces sp. CG 926]|nr:hypothetical protein BCL76_10489 [Streptomyces sp. CG 926]